MTKKLTNIAVTSLLIASVGTTSIAQQAPKAPPPPPAPATLSSTDAKEPARASDTKETVAPKLIPNFAEVTPTLYRGAQPKKGGFEELAKMGINIVVDLRGDRDKEREIVTGLGMQYVPLHWQCSFPKDKTFATFLQLLRDNPGKKVFVHCRLGDDRTAMMVAAYRMAEENWTPEQALVEMQTYGFNFAHRRLICPGLSHYEEHFMERFQKQPAFESLRSKEQPPSSKEQPPVPNQPPAPQPPAPQPPMPQPDIPQSPPPSAPPSPQASGPR